MTPIDVIWTSNVAGAKARGFWDQGLLEAIMAREVWRPAGALEFVHHEPEGPGDLPEGMTGAVVVVHVAQTDGSSDFVRGYLDRLAWALVIVCGDEEHRWESLGGEWRQMPDRKAEWIEAVPEGWPPGTREALAPLQDREDVRLRTLGWYFAGQVTHERRHQCVEALVGSPGGELLETDGFTLGEHRSVYLRKLATARLAPCPSGPTSPDTFRIWEALEAGCIPVADGATPEGPYPEFWEYVAPDAPFPVVAEWSEWPAVREAALADWPRLATRCSAWWQQRRRDLACRLDADVRSFGRRPGAHYGDAPSDIVTVIIPTSPIPTHPSTAVIEETVASIRAQPDLARAEIIVVADGVRPELEHRRADYEEYLHRLVRLTNWKWPNVVPIVHDAWLHQALSVRAALSSVHTPLVLFVEHDTPLTTDMPTDWDGLCRVILRGAADLIRLHHESRILPDHEHLMLDDGDIHDLEGVPLVRTVQFSARPHLASRDYYDRFLSFRFNDDSRTMIEDTMHSVAQRQPWEEHRLWIYRPAGNMQRSYHLDGRADDPKFDMKP